MTARVLPVVLIAASLLAPRAAPAATISLAEGRLLYTAAPGETNVLDVRPEGTAIVFTETAAPLTAPGFFCTTRGPGVVVCDLAGIQLNVAVDLGDGNDRGALVMPAFSTIEAGDGDDTVMLSNLTPLTGPLEGMGGLGNDTLMTDSGSVLARGGPGEDLLSGGAIGSLLDGQEGADRLSGGASGETLLGGPDSDTVLAGDGDDFVQTHAGADVIDGGAGADRVEAGGGNDQVSAGPGDDNLTGGAGHDRVTLGTGRDYGDGGPGNDQLLGRDGVRGRLACGTGKDTVAPDARDRAHLSCETIEQPVRCARRCRAVGVLTTPGGVVIGRGAVNVASGRTKALRVPVSGRGASAVRRAGSLGVRLVVTAGGRRSVTRFSLHTSL